MILVTERLDCGHFGTDDINNRYRIVFLQSNEGGLSIFTNRNILRLDILGGVRSNCTYIGAATLKELTKRTTFIRVREQENNVYGKE